MDRRTLLGTILGLAVGGPAVANAPPVPPRPGVKNVPATTVIEVDEEFPD
jgi:hypothetical protein